MNTSKELRLLSLLTAAAILFSTLPVSLFVAQAEELVSTGESSATELPKPEVTNWPVPEDTDQSPGGLPKPEITTDWPTKEEPDQEGDSDVAPVDDNTPRVQPRAEDTTRPVIVVLGPAANLSTGSDFTITVKATDNVALDRVVVNIKNSEGKNIGTCLLKSASGQTEFTTSCTLDVSDWGVGDFKFRTNARDMAGNVSNTISQNFTIFDKTKPVTRLLAPITGLVTSTDFDITIRSTDNIALSRMIVNIKDAQGRQVMNCMSRRVSGDDQTRTCTVDVSKLGAGTFQLKTNAHDTARNVSNTITQTFTIVDPR